MKSLSLADLLEALLVLLDAPTYRHLGFDHVVVVALGDDRLVVDAAMWVQTSLRK